MPNVTLSKQISVFSKKGIIIKRQSVQLKLYEILHSGFIYDLPHIIYLQILYNGLHFIYLLIPSTQRPPSYLPANPAHTMATSLFTC